MYLYNCVFSTEQNIMFINEQVSHLSPVSLKEFISFCTYFWEKNKEYETKKKGNTLPDIRGTS